MKNTDGTDVPSTDQEGTDFPPQKSLFSLLDEWAMKLPVQAIRDWTLVICAVFVMVQLALGITANEDSQCAAGTVVQSEEEESGFMRTSLRKPGRVLSPIAQRHDKTAGKKAGMIDRQPAALEPTEFVGFEDIPGDYWAVQLAAYDSMNSLRAMVERHQLVGAIGATMMVNRKEVHVLILDVYADKAQALAASRDLPSGMGQINPWVRSVQSIRRNLK